MLHRVAMKQMVAALFLLGLLALAFAQYDGEEEQKQYCRQEELQTMESCKDYLENKCTASSMPITWPWKRRMSSCQQLRHSCCQQLAQMSPPCRCKAICRAFQQIQGDLLGHGSQAQQGQLQTAKAREMAMNLPSICNMYPSYCDIPPTGACY
ncbi:hypothetical protein GUJ93_ZPchr0009g423 [Zizania palustris]|uniref:Bifunctional inhibitor/plant lipid transfer protein/seed storage helical domain-containing protein n=1 Tax=Zizania palustris TaxID=103762 RepID=A0A8J5RNG6_ZIZPA|nr:hypothetical protein GUJ93_ZPchr0009g423 [Zizania palustris]